MIVKSDPGPSLGRDRSQVGRWKLFAKIRTGSIRADQIPTVEQVARFIAACAAHSVGFKATAGLHHPLRNEYRLTYEDDPPRAMLHGFLNVFVAAMLAFDSAFTIATIEEILSRNLTGNFKFDENRLRWRNFEIDAAGIRQFRETGILSFGSCSFLEPTEELQALGYQQLFATV